jgi:hypothetical protein
VSEGDRSYSFEPADAASESRPVALAASSAS